MEECVIKFEDLPSAEWVVSVNESNNLSIGALFMYFFVDVLHGLFVDVVDDDFDFFLWNALLFDILFDKLTSFIRWMIIDVDNMIIWVLLHKNRVKISEIKFRFIIVVWWYNDAEPQLEILIFT